MLLYSIQNASQISNYRKFLMSMEVFLRNKKKMELFKRNEIYLNGNEKTIKSYIKKRNGFHMGQRLQKILSTS